MEPPKSATDTLNVVKCIWFTHIIADQIVTMLVFDQLSVELDQFLKFEDGNLLISILNITSQGLTS